MSRMLKGGHIRKKRVIWKSSMMIFADLKTNLLTCRGQIHCLAGQDGFKRVMMSRNRDMVRKTRC